jgi:hypothetical protein
MASVFRARRDRRAGRRRRWLAASAGILAGVTAFALSAAPATAAPAPSYHAGLDTATFSALGVTDANCFLGVGGDEIWIKPGDKIDFTASLIGLDLGGLQLSGLLTKVAGLHVDVTIDKGTAAEQSFTVDSTDTTRFPDRDQQALKAGAHSLDWTVDSISLLPVLPLNLGKLTTISLAKALDLGAKLNAGATLNWHGTIHVSDNANNCVLPTVSLPGVQITAGKATATTPQVNVDPTAGSSTPPISIDTPSGGSPSTATGGSGTGGSGTPGTGSSGATEGGSGAGTSAGTATHSGGLGGNSGGGFGNALPDGGGANGGFGNAYPDSGGGLTLGHSSNGGKGTVPTGAAPSQHLAAANHNQQKTSADLAAELPRPERMPVLLAILAIIALALVTATYARLYLLRRG